MLGVKSVAGFAARAPGMIGARGEGGGDVPSGVSAKRDPSQKGEAWKDLQIVMGELGLSWG